MNNETTTKMKAQILTNYKIVRETEKAILISTPMIVGKQVKDNEVWMPKSQVKEVNEGLAVALWLIAKNENIQYRTYFDSVARDEEMKVKICLV